MIHINLEILHDVGEEGFEYINFEELKKLPLAQQKTLFYEAFIVRGIAGKFEIKSGNETLTMPMDDLGYVFGIFFRSLQRLPQEQLIKGNMWLSELDHFALSQKGDQIRIALFLAPNEVENCTPDASILLDKAKFWRALQQAGKYFLDFVQSIEAFKALPKQNWEDCLAVEWNNLNNS